MFARVGSYQGAPGKVKEGGRVVNEITPAMQEIQGFQRAYLLVDGKSGKALAMSLWETEEDTNRSTAPTGTYRDKIGRAIEARGEPVVEIFEDSLEIGLPTEHGRFARASVYKGSPDKVDDGIRATRDVEFSLKQMHGFQNMYLFVDRKSGRAMTISFWESEDALNRSASGVNPLRDSVTHALGAAEKPATETFEVVGAIAQRMRKAA